MCESSAPAAPSATQTNTTELPEWARGYAKDALYNASQLTDINQNPYKQYNAPRIAGFSPMQQQAQQGAANMGPASQLGTGTDLATAAGIGALGTNYQGGRFSGGTFGQDAADFYMNPYQQNVIDIGKREAARQSGIQGTQQQAQATQAGAFGGGRDAIMRAERERNLGQQMGDIQAQGSNAAFQQAQQQFNADQARRMQAQQLGEQSRQYGAGLGMQGLQTGLQAAGQLGQLGQTQYGQQMGINQLQNQYGGQQQALAQQNLSQSYQDFLNQQNDPYKRLGFMSDMIRGLPLGQQSAQSIYQAPPSALQTVGALGMGAYGASKLFGSKEGGLMQSYAAGGVTSQQSVESILDKLSDQQLQQAKEAALNRRDVEQANMIDAEMAQRASVRNGLGGAFNQIPEQQQEEMMAGGGIVAFQSRGLVEGEEENDARTGQLVSELMASSEGNPAAYEKITSMFPQFMANINNARYTPMTDTAYNDAITKRRAALEAGAGPSPYADYENKLKGMETEDAKGLEQGKGLAALAAIPAMLEGNNAVRGIGGAGGAFAGAYGQALQADKAQKRSLMNMRINLADSQRKERMGLTRDSISAADQARKDHDAAQQFGITKAKAMASIAGNFATATKPVGGGGPKPLKINEQLAEAEVAFETDPSEANRKRVVALRRAVGQTKLTDYGPTRAGLAGEAIDAPTDRAALAALNEFSTSRTRKRDWQAMITEHGSEEAAREAFIKNYKVTGKNPAPAKPTPKVSSTAPGGGQKIMSMDDVKATAKSSGKTVDEVKVAAEKAGYTIK